MNAISVRELEKRYRGGIQALAGVNLEVPPGEIFGLLGPNGAGKSTLVKSLMTLVRPTGGEGSLLGKPLGDRATLARIGYLPEHVRFPEYLKGREVVEFSARMCGMSGEETKKTAQWALEEVGASDYAHRKLRTYSKGMKQRIGLAQAVVNKPELVFLDEPTDGVDPAGRRDIREALRRMRERGITIFLNSHLLSEMEQLCDRVAVLLKGRVVRMGSVNELTADQQYVLIRTREAVAASQWETWLQCPLDTDSGRGEWHGIPIHFHQGQLAVSTDNMEIVQPLVDLLRQHHHIISHLSLERPTLEELFIQTVDDDRGGDA